MSEARLRHDLEYWKTQAQAAVIETAKMRYRLDRYKAALEKILKMDPWNENLQEVAQKALDEPEKQNET